MDAIYDVYMHLKTTIESSQTIIKSLGGPVSLLIYGSVANGLFDISESEENNQEIQSDLDLTLIIDEAGAKRVNKYKTHLEILQFVKSKLDATKKAQPSRSTKGSSNTCLIKEIFKPYPMSAGPLLEI